MYKKFKKVFLVMSILGILFTNNYANEIKEVQLIDDFSAELLGETKKKFQNRQYSSKHKKLQKKKILVKNK